MALQAEHGLDIPEVFWIRRAQASHDAGLHDLAIESIVRYLEITGQGGEHYVTALELYDTVTRMEITDAVFARNFLAKSHVDRRGGEFTFSWSEEDRATGDIAHNYASRKLLERQELNRRSNRERKTLWVAVGAGLVALISAAISVVSLFQD